VVGFFKTAYGFHHLRYELFDGVIFVFDLFVLKAKMTACFRAFYDDGVGQVVVVGLPFLNDDFSGAAGRYDGYQFGLVAFSLMAVRTISA